MTRNDAAATYRQIRRTYIARQNAGCTVYGRRAGAATFDREAGRYLRDVCGITQPTAADWLDAARALLAYLDANAAA